MRPRLLHGSSAHVRRYAYDLCKLHGLQQPAHWMVLLAIARVGGTTGLVDATTELLEDLRCAIGCPPSTVDDALADCVRVGLLDKISSSSYRASSNFFGDAASDRSSAQLVLVVTYGPGGRNLVYGRQLTGVEQQQIAAQPNTFKAIASRAQHSPWPGDQVA